MKAAVYHKGNDIRIVDMPVPSVSNGELLLKVQASGICGTDLMEWYRVRKAPVVLGHEVCGVVEKSLSPQFSPGQSVFVSHHVPCGSCRYCDAGNFTACETLHKGNFEPGGFCQYIRVPAVNVSKGTFELPEGMGFNEGVLTEPLGCVFGAIRAAGIGKGHKVLVMGSGFSGLLNIMLSARAGAEVYATDVDEHRLALAEEFGAIQAFKPVELPELEADRVIVCTGALEAFEQAFNCVARKGIILWFAIPEQGVNIPIVDFWRNEWTVTSSYGAAPADLQRAINLICEHDFPSDQLLTHHLPLDQIQEGFRLASSGGKTLKVVIHPNGMPL